MIILGIDPGTALTGYGIITTTTPKHIRQPRDQKPKVIDFGCITTTPFDTPGKRLQIIHDELSKIIKKHQPDVISVVGVYFFKNLKTAMPVSQARGVVLFTAAKHNIPTVECTPLQVKMTVVGYGKAEKKQVQEMTRRLLDLSSFDLQQNNRKKDDASDALGIALCALLKS